MTRRLAIVTMLAALALGYVLMQAPAATQQQASGGQGPVVGVAKSQWLGPGSCSSVGCHNGNGLKGELGSEYTTWVLHDPHARAYEVLFAKRSKSIVEKLYPEGGKPAHELALCLNCHVHKDYEKADHQPRFAKEDGVSCESCHGPASSWISDHYKHGLDDKQKLDIGMWDTRSLLGRIRSCTPCHVGKASMEVNHDLIAAGHPRLAFEFSAYHALMPHHWQDAKDKRPGASQRAREDWDAAAWIVGQAATSQAAMELLAARAVWPEFAEADCYACHHQLQAQTWRQDPKHLGQRKPGSLAMNDWYISMLPYGFRGPGHEPNVRELYAEIDKLKSLMEKNATPDRGAVRKHAAAAGKVLEGWIEDINSKSVYSPGLLWIMLDDLAAKGSNPDLKARSWDEATQRYLAVVAVYYAWRGMKGPPDAPNLEAALKTIRSLLQFTADSDSPPPGYTPDLLLNPYSMLRTQLGAKKEK